MPVTILDSSWALDLEPNGATVVDMFTGVTTDMGEADFDAWRKDPSDPKACTEVATMAAVKKELEQLCSDYGHCNTPSVKRVIRFFNQFIEARNKHFPDLPRIE